MVDLGDDMSGRRFRVVFRTPGARLLSQPQPNALGVGAGRSMPPLEPAD